MIKEFLTYLEHQKRYSLNTVEAYQRDLEEFVKWCGGEDELLKVSSSEIRSWLLYLLDSGKKITTVHRKISTLKTFYQYQRREDKLLINPTTSIILPKKEKRLPSFLKEKETKLLFEDFKFSDDFKGIRDEMILCLFYGTGMRVSELASLQLSSIDFGRKVLKVLGKRNKERFIPLLPYLVTSLQNYIEVRNETIGHNKYLFVNEENKVLNRSNIYYIVNKYLRQVSSSLKCSPHVLRHTFATQMLNAGADINALKELLGHSSLAATQVYTHSTREQLKKDYKQAHPRA